MPVSLYLIRVSMGCAVLDRIPLLFIVAITYRLRYYFAWAVSESSLIFSGLSYEGRDPATGRPGWDRCINARIEKVRGTTGPEISARFRPSIQGFSEHSALACQCTSASHRE